MKRGLAAHLSAYVLLQYDWSETSLILDLFTRERGRLAVAAKGAKRPYSQLRGVLLPFQRLSVSLGRGSDDAHAEVHTLRSAEWAGGAPMPSGGALFTGFYLNELLLRLLARQDPHAALFDAYAQVLPVLAAADEAQSQAGLRAFELMSANVFEQMYFSTDWKGVVLILQADSRAAAEAILGRRPPFVGVPYGSDMRLLVRQGATPTVMFGPGDVRDAHAADEHVALDEVAACARVLAAWVVRELAVA